MKNSIPNLAKVSPIKDGYHIFRKWYLSLLLIRHLASSPVGMISITLMVVQAYGNDLAFPLGLWGTYLNWPFWVPWLVASLMSQPIKYLPAEQETWVWSLGWEDSLEEGLATHSSVLACRIPWTEEPGGRRSVGSQRGGHDWATNTRSPGAMSELNTSVFKKYHEN